MAKSPGEIKVWDARTGNELFSLEGHQGGVTSVAVSPDGKRLVSGSWDETVKIRDLATRRVILSLEEHAGTVYGVVFSPDRQRLAGACLDQTVRVWEAETGQPLFTLAGHSSPGQHPRLGSASRLRLVSKFAGILLRG
jgi:WD40 repeat protein